MLSTSFTERPRLASFHTPGLGRRPAWRAEGVPLEPYRKLFQGTGVGLVLQGQIDDHTHPTCGDGVAPKQGHLLEQALCPRPEPSGPVVLDRRAGGAHGWPVRSDRVRPAPAFRPFLYYGGGAAFLLGLDEQ